MITEQRRNYDILISAYDASIVDPRLAGVFYEYRPGRKVEGYGGILKDHRSLIDDYDYIALFDDDLVISGEEISKLFSIVAENNLKIAQPALSHDSYFSYAGLLRSAAFRLRYVNYIEMMCPIFRRDALHAAAPLFAMGYESGIDLIWCNLVAESPRDFAVVDAVEVCHSRPVGGLKAANGFDGSRRYEDDIHAILRDFDLPWLPCVPFGGRLRDGRHVQGRWAFAGGAARLALAIPLRSNWRLRARSVAVHWKHLLTARARNISISSDAAARRSESTLACV